MKISLLIFCLNEIIGLKSVLSRIDKSLFDEVIVFDGGSTDSSIEYSEKLGFNVVHQKMKGLKYVVLEGLNVPTGDVIIMFTPDGNCIPEKLPELVEKLKEGYDLVTVSRYKDDAKSYDDTIISGFGNWVFTKMVNILFKANYTDVLGVYRGFRKDVLTRTGLDKDMKLSFNTQLCIRCAKMGLKVTEIPGDEPKRIGGESSTKTIKHGSMELFTILGEFFSRKKYSKTEHEK
ncbi:glycosyltransferase family 2 protein [candidate division KSB1 bacterium]